MAENTVQTSEGEPIEPLNSMFADNNATSQDQPMDTIEDSTPLDMSGTNEDHEIGSSEPQPAVLANGHHSESKGANGVKVDEEEETGLFGSASEDEDDGPKRKLDDAELDSTDDEDQNDRLVDDASADADMGFEGHSANIMDIKLGRHAVPEPTDGELYLLKFPNFLGLEPKIYRHEDFQPPVTDHHSTGAPSSTFSPYSTAISTIRWRRSPRNPTQLQSNARVLRWSDGSLTMQLASNATEQLELPAKPLAPPQRSPLKPTPTAMNRGRPTNGEAPYNHQLESHTYLTTPHEAASILRVTNHITTSLTVLPSSDQNDDALIRLQESLAAAVRGSKTTADGGVGIISINEDPELAKKKAEVAEREKMRAQRRRQQQEDRERDRANRVLGKSGLSSRTGGGGGGGGLTVGGLEDDADGMATTRARPSKPKRKTRRNSEYSDDDDGFRNRGRTREDEYDEDDGFLVGSDEEPEIVEGSEDEDEGLGDAVSEDERPKKKKSPKRERVVEKVEETGAGGEDGGVAGRRKRRKVVEEEEDE